ncbi:conserved hypothetical protein [Thiocapsa sp. KS1]|nr:hypothetical protein [Thiocapsa sp. KS1]CRI63720.1 conserved hypothetical protein [Thiocapsa sp. KS1]
MQVPTRQLVIFVLCFLLGYIDQVFASIVVESSLTHEKVTQPGESYDGEIIIKNTGVSSSEVKIFIADYTFEADGTNKIGDPGRLPRSNANWIRLSRDVVVVQPNTRERIDFEVKVPGGSADKITGTFWSMVVVEPITPASPESSDPPADRTVTIGAAMRYGVQVITQIGNTGRYNLIFTNPRIIKNDGRRIFEIDVENDGERWLRPLVWLELYTKAGQPIGRLQSSAKRLFPGTSERFGIDLGDTPVGSYLGLVAADGTGDNLFGANVELEIE